MGASSTSSESEVGWKVNHPDFKKIANGINRKNKKQQTCAMLAGTPV